MPDLTRLAKLPHADVTWQIGVHALPEPSDPDGARFLLMCCVHGEFRRALLVLRDPPTPAQWRQVFAAAALANDDDNRPELPTHLETISPEGLTPLSDVRELGVSLNIARKPLAWQANAEAVKILWLEDKPIPSDIERPLWAAAGAIARLAPWKWMDDEAELHVTVPQGLFAQTEVSFDSEAREGAVIVWVRDAAGDGDDMFYVRLERAKQECGREERAEGLALPLVDGWVPAFVRMFGDGEARLPSVAEQEALAAILQAVQAFAAAHGKELQQAQACRGSWPTLAGDALVVFAPGEPDEEVWRETFTVPHELALSVRADGRLPLVVAIIALDDLAPLAPQFIDIASVIVEETMDQGQPGLRLLAVHDAGAVTSLGTVPHRPAAWLDAGGPYVGIGWAAQGAVPVAGLVDPALVVLMTRASLGGGHA